MYEVTMHSRKNGYLGKRGFDTYEACSLYFARLNWQTVKDAIDPLCFHYESSDGDTYAVPRRV